ncbi:S-layer homology domain-containing protein [Peptoniphilus sp. oral taxon 386]|uniref:S-layer homology domain-containing protein n=1 Tax=Peptoniphilus sp. oral taxon 386 TaxID=652713 RepID=UPI0003051F87|nr:S-layer homology domain-containing protein [Peptoniphilus sp. oral taxon 386]
MKRTKVFYLTVAVTLSFMIISQSVFAKAMSFTDVPTSAWYYNDVNLAYEKGLINGRSEKIFAPDENMTYAEAVKLAACMHQKATMGSVTLTNGNPWYQTYVDYAKNNGIISGELAWMSSATRAGYMAIFAKALPASEMTEINTIADGSIPDVPMTMTNAAEIYKLYKVGIVQGVDVLHNCSPNSNIKRSEVAAILSRMMDKSKRLTFSMSGTNKEFEITKQPTDQTISFESWATFEIQAKGEGLTYQWEGLNNNEFVKLNDSSEISGSNTSILRLKGVANFNGVKGRCVVKDKNGNTLISQVVSLTVTGISNTKPVILVEPSDISAKIGDTVYVEVVATGEGLTYQWEGQMPGYSFSSLQGLSGISGINTNRLGVVVSEALAGAKCRCIIKDKNGNTVITREALLTVQPIPLKITKQPVGQSGSAGSSWTLSVEAEGVGLTYQWYSMVLMNYPEPIDGAVYSSYTTSLPIISRRYYCIVKDKFGNTVKSDTVTLSGTNVVYP